MREPRLGIVAGAGALPARLLDACRAAGRETFVLAIERHADAALVADVPHAWVRLGAVGSAIKILRDNRVSEIVLAGSVGRPTMSDLMPDGRALRLLSKGILSGGDDALLKSVIKTLETEEGFKVIGAQELLAGDLAPEGRIGAVAPDALAEADIARGVAILRAMGVADIGQSVVVQQGVALGVEAVEGTDALLDRVGPLKRGGPGGVLLKLPKPGQELRADIPVIGARTAERVAAAGLRGIAVQAGGVLILDRDRLIATADRAGLFLLGLKQPA